jgi:hypothetical protein
VDAPTEVAVEVEEVLLPVGQLQMVAAANGASLLRQLVKMMRTRLMQT